jgi:hypothetical protein
MSQLVLRAGVVKHFAQFSWLLKTRCLYQLSYLCIRLYQLSYICIRLYQLSYICISLYQLSYICIRLYQLSYICISLYQLSYICISLYQLSYICIRLYQLSYLCITSSATPQREVRRGLSVVPLVRTRLGLVLVILKDVMPSGTV